MKVSRTVEILVGLFMLGGFVALFFLAMQVSNLGTVTSGGGYAVYARFDNIGGLKVRSPVTMAGVRIGQVGDIRFDEHGDLIDPEAPFGFGEVTPLLEMPVSWSMDDHPHFEYVRAGQVVLPGLRAGSAVLENWIGDYQ